MSDCKICFHKGDGKVMQRPLAGECAVCNPTEAINPAEDACVCPPLGEPKHLPILAPVVFDECGINLCREIAIPTNIIEGYPETENIELKVVDIDFNFDHPNGSSVETIARRPNCVRIRLARLCVKFVAKLYDARCRVIAEKCFTVEYLPDQEDPSYDEDTNPSAVIVELYAPYGVSYFEVCGKCKPVISFLGFVEGPESNNSLRQGLVAQALAKVIELDYANGVIAAGISIYLKSVYFVQYKIEHAGLCVPPKCVPIGDIAEDACKDFVEGDLLEQSIQPLEVCQRPKSFNPCAKAPVEDPTPAEGEQREENKRKGGFRF